MKNNRIVNLSTRQLVHFILVIIMMTGCARMGQPDGGWYDDRPPQIIATTPTDNGTGVKEKKVVIYFDEYIKVEDATNNVVVSPPQLEMPEIKGAGKKIVVELKDTLKENTTYTIDFSDAITDNNEGNPLGNYTFTFSTGAEVDTMEVSGTILDASNLEPVKGIMVGLYADLEDSAFYTKPLLRVARTDSRGRFIIRGVAKGKYRAYALQDMDGDYKYSQKGEMIAFSDRIIEPTCGPDTRQDTIWRDSLRIDTIIRRGFTHFYPDDVVMRAFTVPLTDRYMIKNQRQEPDRLEFFFSYGSDSLPKLRGLNFDADSAFIVDANLKKDTITYWIKDTALVNRDSLEIEYSYHITDTLGQLVPQTDTLLMVPKLSYEKRMKMHEKELEKWQKQQDKLKKKGERYDSVWLPKPLDIRVTAPSSLTPESYLYFTMPAPLARCDTSMIHLQAKVDTLWVPQKFDWQPRPQSILSYRLEAVWTPGTEYQLEVDSAAFESIYGIVNDKMKSSLKCKSEEEFGSLVVKIAGLPDSTTAIVQLLDKQDGVVKEARTQDDGSAEFYWLSEGKFYLRAFIDRNGNGIWDPGDFYKALQPEEMYYLPKVIEIKANWDITTEWNLTQARLDRQKPLEITKQKPEKEKQLKNRNKTRAEQLGIPFDKIPSEVRTAVTK